MRTFPSLQLAQPRTWNENEPATEPAMKVWQYLLAAILSLVTSAASAETIDINNDRGGFVFVYQAKWEKLALQHVNVRISGPCLSACTILLGYIPRRDICVTPNASFGFHLATMQFATDQLWKAYPDDIRGWITQNGGLEFIKILWLQAPEIYHYFHKCSV
jgi:hypothetical protein